MDTTELAELVELAVVPEVVPEIHLDPDYTDYIVDIAEI
jgi:hypothetical protein